MSTRNDITGDALISKSATSAYRDGWDRIFGKKPKTLGDIAIEKMKAGELPTPDQLAEQILSVQPMGKQPLKLMTWELYLPDHLDEEVLKARPASLDDRANWWSWCEKHQHSISNIPSFQAWRDAHSSAA